MVPDSNKTDENLDGSNFIAHIIAYQIGWGQLLISWYEAGVQQKKIIMPGEGFSTWNYSALAERFRQKYHLDGAIQQIALLDQTVHAILVFVEKEYQSGQLDKTGVWDWCTLPSGKMWPLSKWVQVNTVAPYKRAASSIKKFLSRNIFNQ